MDCIAILQTNILYFQTYIILNDVNMTII